MPIRRPCIRCGDLFEGAGSYCPTHAAERLAQRAARDVGRLRAKSRARAHAPGDGAAARLRRAINKAGGAQCAACGYLFAAMLIEVDHILALHKGGLDVVANVRPMCRPCHRAKTAEERRSHP